MKLEGRVRIAIGIPDDDAARLFSAFPDCAWWEVRGERVVRGQMFLCNCWRYVYLGETRMLTEVFTAEFLDDVIGGEATVLKILVTGPRPGGIVSDRDARALR